jgi:glucose-1-phosphate adenylyltransferase
LVREGCGEGGKGENSIIFRKVRIGKGAVIRNSIIFEQTTVMNGAHIDCVITGKGSAILEGVSIISHSSMPAVISSGRIVG